MIGLLNIFLWVSVLKSQFAMYGVFSTILYLPIQMNPNVHQSILLAMIFLLEKFTHIFRQKKNKAIRIMTEVFLKKMGRMTNILLKEL